jgi:hypothetical protein
MSKRFDTFRKILKEAVPVILMIVLIPIISDDYVLLAAYILITIAWFLMRREPHDGAAYVFGLIVITISEYLFVQTGVETFTRNSLLGLMPIWLPFLWAYAFVVIKRSVQLLNA